MSEVRLYKSDINEGLYFLVVVYASGRCDWLGINLTSVLFSGCIAFYDSTISHFAKYQQVTPSEVEEYAPHFMEMLRNRSHD